MLRSTDGGESWSDPINLDGTDLRFVGRVARTDATLLFSVQDDYGAGDSEWLGAPLGDHGVYAHTQSASGRVWETRSLDDGLTWAPVGRGAVYSAAEAAFTTASGVMLEAGRVPAQGLHVTYDGGKHWETFVIDVSGSLSNGGFAEVAPDVVLYGYGGTYREADSPRHNASDAHNTHIRAQLFKVDRAARRIRPIPFEHPHFDDFLRGDMRGLEGAAPPAEAARRVVRF